MNFSRFQEPTARDELQDCNLCQEPFMPEELKEHPNGEYYCKDCWPDDEKEEE